MTQGNITPIQAAENPIDPGVRIGHVHLRTADVDRVRDFYVGVLVAVFGELDLDDLLSEPAL
jgi:catechol 2,3-dioxygenase